MSDVDRRILLGRIVGAHGIKGEVKVASHTADPGAIAGYGPLSDKSGSRSFKLKVVSTSSKGVIARVEGVSDRNAAEKLKGTDLYVARDRLPDPEDGSFYHEDLVGLTARTQDGSTVGRVVAVQNFGAGDLLEIQIAGKRETELLPFQDAFVPTVDLPGGFVVVVLPESGGSEGDGDDRGES